jgi:glutamate 5-kinase
MRINVPGHGEIDVKRAVIKLGTKQVTDLESVNTPNLRNLVAQVASLKKRGVEIILTVSGAVGMAVYHLYRSKVKAQSLSVAQKQALAGYGQVYLMQLLAEEFGKADLKVGQVLLTHDLFENRATYLNARNTMNTMLSLDIIPVINENDSVATEEIQIGDNDRLGAYVALLTDANLYVMLSDIDGLYRDYRQPSQTLVSVVENLDDVLEFVGEKEEAFTKGGMATKLAAARITTVGGVPAVIANGFKDNVLLSIFDRLSEGTIFLPLRKNLNYKKRWITGKKAKGKLVIDEGAAAAVKRHKSLLPSGITSVEGEFGTGDTVSITDSNGAELARGLSNYSAADVKRIAGRRNSEIGAILGVENVHSAVVHIDNMVVFVREE